MKLIVLDYESYYDSKTYTLKKLSTEEYIRDSRFEAHGCALKTDAAKPAFWVPRNYLPQVFSAIDWANAFVVSHHAAFDALITRWHYGYLPKMLGCTMSMARYVHGNHIRVGLDALRARYNMPAKTTPYNLFDGKHWNEMSPAVQKQVADGACDEVESVWKIFSILARDFPPEEYSVLDMVLRMHADPALYADVPLLREIWRDEETKKATALADLGFDVSTREGREQAETELQSADRFSELLRRAGVEPEMKEGKPDKEGKPRYIPAFAKTDNFMRDLLEHEDPYIQALAEARLGVKSTILQTRAEAFGTKALRGGRTRSDNPDWAGPMPVYLNYCGASTLRVSGGDGDNWLNLKRGSKLRKSIVAPEGYVLAPVDSSQIECRVLHYLAGGPDEPVIQKFRNGEDPYTGLASRFYGEPIYKARKDDPRAYEMETKRGMGKQGRLMCLGPATKVLTRRGFISITEVLDIDQLWDGIEWVKHQGLIFQGVRTVENFAGVEMTSDHLVLCDPQNWLPASFLRNASILSRALDVGSENLPSQASRLGRRAGLSKLWSGALAALLNIQSILQTCTRDAARAVGNAHLNKQDFGLKNITVMQTFAPTNNIAPAYLGASGLCSRVANHRTTTRIIDTEVEASKFINRGDKTVKSFWPICSLFLGGMIRAWTWIEKTMMGTTLPGTFGSSLEKPITKTDIQSRNLNKKSCVFDIACAGPRNRFTILSEQGPLIVHNCGYGAAGAKFKITAKNGLYGPPVDIPLEDANEFVRLYREDNPSITHKVNGYWAQCELMLKRLWGGPGDQFGPLTIEASADRRRIRLPNGAAMVYDTLEWHVPDLFEECRDFERSGYWRVKTRDGYKKMWGSKLTQNICEAVSRVIVSQAMLRIWRQYGIRTLNWPYDELLLLIPKDGREEKTLETCMIEMKRTPDWLPGLPLDCEGSLGDRYSK